MTTKSLSMRLREAAQPGAIIRLSFDRGDGELDALLLEAAERIRQLERLSNPLALMHVQDSDEVGGLARELLDLIRSAEESAPAPSPRPIKLRTTS